MFLLPVQGVRFASGKSTVKKQASEEAKVLGKGCRLDSDKNLQVPLAVPLFGFYSPSALHRRKQEIPAKVQFGMYSAASDYSRLMDRFNDDPDFETFRKMMAALNKDTSTYASKDVLTDDTNPLQDAMVQYIRKIPKSDPEQIQAVDRILTEGKVAVSDRVAGAVERKMEEVFPNGELPFTPLPGFKNVYTLVESTVYTNKTQVRRMVIGFKRDPENAKPIKALTELYKRHSGLFKGKDPEARAHGDGRTRKIYWNEALEPIEALLVDHCEQLARAGRPQLDEAAERQLRREDEDADEKLRKWAEARDGIRLVDDCFTIARFPVSDKLAEAVRRAMITLKMKPSISRPRIVLVGANDIHNEIKLETDGSIRY